MILTFAVLLGLLAGLIRAWYHHTRLRVPEIRSLWLLPIAFIPQFLAFQFQPTRGSMPDDWAAVALVSSQVILLVFVGLNRSQKGVLLMGAGLGLNLAVIVLNGGWMPISPETVFRLIPDATPNSWSIGSRLGFTKDLVLPIEQTRLWWLSDRFLFTILSQRIAFSLGDMVMSLGIIYLLWEQGALHEKGAYPDPLNRILSIFKDGRYV